jgi:hypothetical protein
LSFGLPPSFRSAQLTVKHIDDGTVDLISGNVARNRLRERLEQ